MPANQIMANALYAKQCCSELRQIVDEVYCVIELIVHQGLVALSDLLLAAHRAIHNPHQSMLNVIFQAGVHL